MPRVIRYFDKIDESYVDEVILPDILLVCLQDIFNISIDNPMYDCYLIDKSHQEFFNKNADFDFDFERFDYFLEYDA